MFDYERISSDVNKIFNHINKNKLKDEGLETYSSFYASVIKSFENHEHYERSFEIINPIFERYLDNFLQFDKNKFKFFDQNKIKICFYLPNISNSLAHIDLLHKTLNDFNEENYDLYIATNKNFSNNISYKIKNLINRKIIKEIIHVDILSIKDIKKFSYRYKNFFERFIVWAVPLIIPLWIRVFSNKVIYVSLKFKYSSFINLSKGIYFSIDKNKEECQLKNTIWKKVETELIDLSFIEHSRNLNKNKVRFITVNRIEKIRNEFFLDTVCEILKKIPSANFSYTGRADDPLVRNYFRLNNFDDRAKFIGWVNPNEIINDYDIFLDVPYLSGIISANYFMSGMPVVSFEDTTSSYIDMIKNELYNQYKIKFTFKSKKDYVDYVIKLTTDKEYFNKIRRNQIDSKFLFKKNNINLSQNFFRAIDEKNTI